MSDGSLSQEEIDALLQGADDFSSEQSAEPSGAAQSFSDNEKNKLQSLASEMAQAMGTTLSTISGQQISIQNPRVDVVTREDVISQFSTRTVQTTADYTGGDASGKHSYVLPEGIARQIASVMMAQEGGELTDMALSAITEGFSQMSGASLNIIQEKAGKSLNTADLNSILREDPQEIETPSGSFIRIRYNCSLNNQNSFIEEVMGMEAARAVVSGLGGGKNVQPQKQFQPGFAEQPQTYSEQPKQNQSNVGVQPVQFSQLSSSEQTGAPGNIGLLMDVSMQLTVELGRTKMLVKDILGMGEGTIVELDKLAGEPVDLLVNGKLIAKGEVVVIDENFGVRVTDIISPMERISNLE
ncbi:MAG: flagellar motor switch phosphatase FliY [Spirochaetota bacterium]